MYWPLRYLPSTSEPDVLVRQLLFHYPINKRTECAGCAGCFRFHSIIGCAGCAGCTVPSPLPSIDVPALPTVQGTPARPAQKTVASSHDDRKWTGRLSDFPAGSADQPPTRKATISRPPTSSISPRCRKVPYSSPACAPAAPTTRSA